MNTGLESLKKRADFAVAAIWAVIAASTIMIVVELAYIVGLISSNNITGLSVSVYGIAGMTDLLVQIVSWVLVAFWIHRAHANLHEAGIEGLEFTPGWVIGWYFVPIFNLFKPFQAMKELWNTSVGLSDQDGGETPFQLKIWWACWLLPILVNLTFFLMPEDPIIIGTAYLAVAATTIASAWFLMRIINAITQEQVLGVSTAKVFE